MAVRGEGLGQLEVQSEGLAPPHEQLLDRDITGVVVHVVALTVVFHTLKN